MVLVAYNLDSKMPDNDLVENEMVAAVVVVEELRLDSKALRHYSKYFQNMTLMIFLTRGQAEELTLISNSINEICCEY